MLVPVYLHKTDMHRIFVGEFKNSEYHPSQIPSYKSFSTMIKEQFSNYKFAKRTELGKCDRCEELNLQSKKQLSPVHKAQLEQDIQAHSRIHTGERNAYQNRRKAAIEQPDSFISIIVDCPSSVFIPHHVPVTKGTATYSKVEFAAVGIVNHGLKLAEYQVLISKTYPKDPNLIISAIFNHIIRILASYPSPNEHPPILFIQLDNCVKENKNRYLFAFFNWLVEIGWFKSVQVSFLPVGHTHEDIDQMFSVMRNKIHKFSVHDLDDLKALIER